MERYYDNCYYDVCGCDLGGDCTCLCDVSNESRWALAIVLWQHKNFEISYLENDVRV